MAVCSNCGEGNPERARFCLACGAELSAGEPQREARKTVSILFCDVTGSTAMGEKLDPESQRNVMTRYFDAMQAVIQSHGGTVEKFIGDAVMAVFGVPVLHEDDALRAVRAAADMRAALADLNVDLERERGVRIQTRIGVNTGEVVAGTGTQTVVTGDAVNTGARLEQNASPGETLIGEATYRLVRDAVHVEPVGAIDAKGKSEPLTAYRLVGILEIERDAGRRLGAPLVGRGHELQLAVDAFERTRRERASHLFTIFGTAGVGKSRLTQEVVARIQDEGTVCRGRCLPYGRGITFWPLAEIIHDLAGLAGDETPAEAQTKIAKLVEGDPHERVVAERVAGLIGLGDSSGMAEESFWAVRKLFESQAARRPLIVVFDDIHWAEPALLDLIEHVADWTDEAPILLICLARPELLEARPGWAGGKVNATSIRLEPLRDDESEALVTNLLGGLDLPAGLLARINEAAGGTPLFVEEMVGMLIDDGAITYDGASWVMASSIDEVPVPPTITALLAARLDRLAPDERRAIEAASVVGKEFWTDAVAALLPGSDGASVRSAIVSLVRKDVARPDRSHVRGEEAFRFRHVLIRNAAYNAIAKAERARLHDAFASWLELRFADRIAEYEEIIGYHLEQAFEARVALGPADSDTRALAGRAARRLVASGRRALGRGDDNAARGLFGRASDLLGNEAPADFLLDLARATRFFDARGSVKLFADTVEAAQREGRPTIEWRARAEGAYAHIQTASGANFVPETKKIARDAIRVLEEAGDNEGAAIAWTLLSDCHNSVGEHAEMLAAAENAVEFARRAGDERGEFLASRLVNSALTWGPAPLAEHEARARRLMKQSEASPLRRAVALRWLAGALAGAGEFEEARRLSEEGLDLFKELGQTLAIASRGFAEGNNELLAGEPARAEAILRESCDDLERIGEVGLLSTLVCVHGEALWELDRIEEAEECSVRGEQLGALDDLATQIYWRRLRGKVRAKQGRFDEAITLSREAVGIAESTQGLVWQAQSLNALSQVLELGGRTEEAVEVALDALDRFERKGIVAEIQNVRARIDRLRKMK